MPDPISIHRKTEDVTWKSLLYFTSFNSNFLLPVWGIWHVHLLPPLPENNTSQGLRDPLDDPVRWVSPPCTSSPCLRDLKLERRKWSKGNVEKEDVAN